MTPPPSDTWDTATVRRQTRSVKQRSGELTCRKSGVQVNEVKDLKPFQDRMAPTYDLVASKVGKEWMDRIMAAVKAAARAREGAACAHADDELGPEPDPRRERGAVGEP